MPYTAPHTIVTGELVTPTTMNNEWGGNVSFLANPPACVLSRNTAQSIPSGASTAISWDTEQVDTDTMHDLVTNPTRITFKTAGLYIITAGFVVSGTTGHRELDILSGGSALLAHVRVPTATSSFTAITISRAWKFAVNNFIEIRAFQDSGSAQNIGESGHSRVFATATWIGLG